MNKIKKYSKLDVATTDYLLIGAGVMSATLGTILKQIDPSKSITISEKLSSFALESSNVLNNAGTGHAGYCEINYTPLVESNTIDVTKAVKVNNAFLKSLEFWKYLIEKGLIKSDFLHNVPHYCFVSGNKDVEFLKMRYFAMKSKENFSNMDFSEDFDEISKWLPLMMNGRDKSEKVAATKVSNGYDVDFGKLTGYLIDYLGNNDVNINYNKEIIDLYKIDQEWHVIQRDLITNQLTCLKTKFVFIGAGGAAITLLEKSGIPEGKNYGGFPVSGQWLICNNPDVVSQHHAKVYGKPSVGSPPMSVPHLDTRIINGKNCLLFGPFAGMSTKFLKNGSNFDWFKSIRLNNIWTIISAGLYNMGLNKYLIGELIKGDDDKFEVLRTYYPEANKKDWKLSVAGQRVQIIKKFNGKGVIEFGTEVVSDSKGSLACLLGASPGASTSVKIMIDLLNQCFQLDEKTKTKISEMIPSYKD
jgi:malate dehydrogenase (quinone)